MTLLLQRSPFSKTAVIVGWQKRGVPPKEAVDYKGASVCKSPGAAQWMCGSPWVLWLSSVAGHQGKHMGNRWPLLCSSHPWIHCWLRVINFFFFFLKGTETEREGKRERETLNPVRWKCQPYVCWLAYILYIHRYKVHMPHERWWQSQVKTFFCE